MYLPSKPHPQNSFWYLNLVIRDFGGNVNLVIWAIDSGILRTEYSA